MFHLVLQYRGLDKLTSRVPASFEAKFLSKLMDLAGTIVVGAGYNHKQVLSTLVLCRAVITIHDIMSNLWQSGIITFFIIELYEVSKTCVVEYMIVVFPLIMYPQILSICHSY